MSTSVDNTSFTLSSNLIKPGLTALLAAAGDMYLLKETDSQKSVVFGMAVAGGTFLGAMVASQLPVVTLPGDGTYYDSKTLEQRLVEVGAGAGAAYIINTQFLKNDYEYSKMYMKLAVIAGSDFIAEYATDYYKGITPSFFA